MAYSGIPVSFTSGSAPSNAAPLPFVVVGNVPVSSLALATTSTAGVVKKASTVAASTGSASATYDTTTQNTITNIQTQLNALIANLKTAGVVA